MFGAPSIYLANDSQTQKQKNGKHGKIYVTGYKLLYHRIFPVGTHLQSKLYIVLKMAVKMGVGGHVL